MANRYSKFGVFSSVILFLSSSVNAQEANMSFVYGINAGSDSSAEMGGHTFQPDRFFNNGSTNDTTDPIHAISDDTVFQSERYGDVSYDIPVSNSNYTVILHLLEMYHTDRDLRSFNVSVEGQTVISNLDIHELVGHDTAFEYVVEDVAVSDGYLNISFETVLENAQVCGISIYSNNGGRVLD